MPAHEYPVSDEMMDAMADEALGPEPVLEPADVPDAAPRGTPGLARRRERERRHRLLVEQAPNVRDALSARRKKSFLQALARTGNVSTASAYAGWGQGVAYSVRKGDPEFAKRWEWALEAYVGRLEDEADRRAVDGVEVGVYHKGELVGTEVRYSDQLLALLLKANAREKYGDKVDQTVTAKGGVLVVPAAPGSTADWESAARDSQARFRDAEQEG
jgi:hypothetical protein